MRPDFNSWSLMFAHVAASRATCCKRQVGAVVFDTNNKIVSTGYNGPPAGQPHCTEQPCRAITQTAPASHIGCAAVHAEANALIQAGLRALGGTLAVTTSPCYQCAAMIVNAGIKKVIVGEYNKLWQNTTDYETSPQKLFIRANIEVIYAAFY